MDDAARLAAIEAMTIAELDAAIARLRQDIETMIRIKRRRCLAALQQRETANV